MTFDFDVKRNSTYLELIITNDNMKFSSGLLGEAECVDMAQKLIYAAEQLLPAGYGGTEQRLWDIRNGL